MRTNPPGAAPEAGKTRGRVCLFCADVAWLCASRRVMASSLAVARLRCTGEGFDVTMVSLHGGR